MYIAPANTAAVSGASISSTAFNTLETDIGTEITNSLDRGGRSSMTAALPMGGQKITGAADPTVATDVATKNYVDTTTAAFFSTGDVKLTLKITPDTGWLICDDGTFGSASSSSSNRSNADTQSLFTLFFNNLSDAAAPMFTSGGASTTRAAQVSASAAWAANCKMSLTRTMGFALGGAGSGAGLTPRVLGSVVGQETIILGTANLPPYTPTGTVPVSGGSNVAVSNGVSINSSGGSGTVTITGVANVTASFSGTAQGGTSTPFTNLQPTTFMNIMVKL